MRLITSLVLWAVLAAPAFAQAPRADFSRSLAPTISNAEWTGRKAAQPYVPAEPTTVLEGGLPPNLVIPSRIEPVVERMWQRSPTFRRQCARLTSAPRLTVAITVGQAPDVSSSRAITHVVSKAGGRLEATVHIRTPDDLVELIAHEIEHIVEQLDGVDLQKRTTDGDGSVIFTEDRAFETRRAQETGLKVAREVRAPGVS